MAIEISNRQRLVPLVRLVRSEIIRIAAGALAAARPRGQSSGAEAVIAFVRDPALHKLNAAYRGRDEETDVLSFPPSTEYNPDSGVYIGDVVISTDAVVRQAALAGHSVEREINELVIHGILHLCGY
ncbi:MAG TPA: rRNA maturation RNase YbeY, partial [Blastocatellia bacterium]